MKPQTSLKLIKIFSAAGFLFSGWLTFSEVIQNVCPLGGCGKLLGVPTCAYGFTMFTVILILLFLAEK